MAGISALRKLLSKSQYATSKGGQSLDNILQKGQDLSESGSRKIDNALGKIPAMQKKFEPSTSDQIFGAGSNPGNAIGNLNQAGELDPKKKAALMKALGIAGGAGGLAAGAGLVGKASKDRLEDMNEDERMAFEKMLEYNKS